MVEATTQEEGKEKPTHISSSVGMVIITDGIDILVEHLPPDHKFAPNHVYPLTVEASSDDLIVPTTLELVQSTGITLESDPREGGAARKVKYYVSEQNPEGQIRDTVTAFVIYFENLDKLRNSGDQYNAHNGNEISLHNLRWLLSAENTDILVRNPSILQAILDHDFQPFGFYDVDEGLEHILDNPKRSFGDIVLDKEHYEETKHV